MDTEDLQNILRLFSGVKLPLSVEQMSRILQAQQLEADDRLEVVGDRIASIGWQYFLHVWIPVWVLHHCYPPQLFHLARCGDIDALDDLLRIDSR